MWVYILLIILWLLCAHILKVNFVRQGHKLTPLANIVLFVVGPLIALWTIICIWICNLKKRGTRDVNQQ